MLSFLTLYPGKWKANSYIVLNGVSEHALLGMLRDYSNLNEVILCLDHDPAGIEASGRLAEIVMCEGNYCKTAHCRRRKTHIILGSSAPADVKLYS